MEFKFFNYVDFWKNIKKLFFAYAGITLLVVTLCVFELASYNHERGATGPIGVEFFVGIMFFLFSWLCFFLVYLGRYFFRDKAKKSVYKKVLVALLLLMIFLMGLVSSMPFMVGMAVLGGGLIAWI